MQMKWYHFLTATKPTPSSKGYHELGTAISHYCVANKSPVIESHTKVTYLLEAYRLAHEAFTGAQTDLVSHMASEIIEEIVIALQR